MVCVLLTFPSESFPPSQRFSVLQEEEMRRLVAVQRELHGGDTSQSDWSEEDEEVGADTDDPDAGLDQLSMAANGGLTDAEGAMSG